VVGDSFHAQDASDNDQGTEQCDTALPRTVKTCDGLCQSDKKEAENMGIGNSGTLWQLAMASLQMLTSCIHPCDHCDMASFPLLIPHNAQLS
jgi:hypothetical protein